MPDRANLLRAVLDHPDDDTPRLIYADCVQEEGDTDRAEFIRVQCEKERCEKRERELLTKCGRGWLEELFGKKYKDNLIFYGEGKFVNPFSRGFVNAVKCTTQDMNDRFPEWVKKTPLEIVELHHGTEASNRSALHSIGRDALANQMKDMLREVTSRPEFANIRHLHFLGPSDLSRHQDYNIYNMGHLKRVENNRGIGIDFAAKDLKRVIQQSKSSDFVPDGDFGNTLSFIPHSMWDRTLLPRFSEMRASSKSQAAR